MVEGAPLKVNLALAANNSDSIAAMRNAIIGLSPLFGVFFNFY